MAWDERQQYMPGHLARRVACNGASRNLVVRFIKPDMTPEDLREDLAHIHRLEVVEVSFDSGHAYISLNSIQQAITARSCMLSRFKYKGTRIEFYPDECDQPLPTIVKKHVPRPSPVHARTWSHRNRFALLFNGSEESGKLEHNTAQYPRSTVSTRTSFASFGSFKITTDHA